MTNSNKQFFSYDPEGDGIQFHESLSEAEQTTKNAIPEYLNDYWDEDGVRQVCTGIILYQSNLTYRKIRPPDEELDDEGYDVDGHWWGRIDGEDGLYEFDEYWDFTLEPQKIPDEVLALIPTEDLIQELSSRPRVDEVQK